MITKVEIYTAQGGELVLPFDDVTSGYIVKEIGGLDPVKATIVSSSFALIDGSQYQNSRRENRNILMKLGLSPDFVTTTVASLRTNLYRYLMPKSMITMRFFVDNVQFADVSGRVESLESVLFSKDPELNISIICFDPDFISPSNLAVNDNTVSNTTERSIQYNGTVEAGFNFRLDVDRDINEFVLYNTVPGGESYAFQFGNVALEDGDVLNISTVPGNKFARLTRSGTVTSVLYGVSPTSSWFPLLPGVNLFRAYAEGAPIPYTITYQPRYGGL